jgi:hypothetical protein
MTISAARAAQFEANFIAALRARDDDSRPQLCSSWSAPLYTIQRWKLRCGDMSLAEMRAWVERSLSDLQSAPAQERMP